MAKRPQNKPRRPEKQEPAATSGTTAAVASFFETRNWLAGLLLAVLVFAAYLPALRCGFIWDDDAYVTGNLTLRSSHGLLSIWTDLNATPQYYPLVHTTFWLEYHLWKLNPLGYHADNLLLHALAAVLLWRLLRKLQLPGAWLAAAIFATHPVEVESVAWISERKNVLSGVFYLAAALCYLRFAGWTKHDEPTRPEIRSWRWYALAVGLFIAALLSKTVTCSLPAALLLICWWKRGKWRWSDIAPLLPFFALGLGLSWLTAHLEKMHVGAHGADWALSFWQRCLIAGRALWFYAGKLIWPSPLIFIYPRWVVDLRIWWQWLFPIAAFFSLGGLWIGRKKIGRGPLVAVLFFAGTLFPALGFVNVYPMLYSFVADHFQYLAGIGLMAVAAAAWSWLPRSGRFLTAIVLLATLITLTRQQTKIYSDLPTLWRTTLALNPGCWMAHDNLAAWLIDAGEPGEAIKQCKQALQLKPNDDSAYYNWGLASARQGKLAEAIEQYQRALQFKQDSAEIHNNWGVALSQLGKLDEAVENFSQALQINPYYAEAHNNWGNALAKKGRLEEAIAHYQQALRLNPDFIEAYNNLGNVLLMEGKPGEAGGQFQKALQLKPDYAEARFNLGNALLQQREWDKAAEQYQQVLQFTPNDARVHYNLAQVLINQGKTNEAQAHLEKALELAARQDNQPLLETIQASLDGLAARPSLEIHH